MMSQAGLVRIALAVGIVAIIAMSGTSTYAQPNPYRLVEPWAKLPSGRTWGYVNGAAVDREGNIWTFERCGGYTCAGSNLAPLLKFDPSGNLLKSFGAGMFVFPHGIYVDKDDNVWVTDGGEKDGKGEQVFKFSPDGKVLLTLGKAGVAGEGPDTFDSPSAVVVAPNGDIFVADGHDFSEFENRETNARIVKFSKDGKFIKTWGKKGSAPGEFNKPHAIAMDSKGRLFVADEHNNRIQIFDQEGKYLEEWKQFGRPAGIFIDAKDTIYVADNQSEREGIPGFREGIRIGSAKDGIVTAFIPALGACVGSGPCEDRPEKRASTTEGVAADAMGNIYAAESRTKNFRKYVKK